MFDPLKSQASEGSFMSATSCSLVSQHHSSFCANRLQVRKSATRRLLKLLVSNCQTSAEKLPDLSAEVGEVLLCVFLTLSRCLFFACIMFVIHNYFVNLQCERCNKHPRRRYKCMYDEAILYVVLYRLSIRFFSGPPIMM